MADGFKLGYSLTWVLLSVCFDLYSICTENVDLSTDWQYHSTSRLYSSEHEFVEVQIWFCKVLFF